LVWILKEQASYGGVKDVSCFIVCMPAVQVPIGRCRLQQRPFNCSGEPLELLVGCSDCGRRILYFALRAYDNGDVVWPRLPGI
jgi:hypothetical protein